MIGLLAKINYPEIEDLGKEYDSNFANKYLNDHSDIYIYKKEDKVLGFLISEKTLDENSIILLYVSKDYRRKKVGSLLLEYYINNTSINNRIILEVSSNNNAAINLYEKFGFKTISIRKEYYKDKSDALLMEKRLNNE